MSKADIWMPFYVADYLADTMHLSAAEHGGYLMLILHYWRTGPIPNDPERLANISRLGNAWGNASSTLLAFFEQEDGMLIHRRVEREKQEALSNKCRNEARARAGAAKRWANHYPSNASSNASSNATNVLDSCSSPSPSPSPSVDNKTIVQPEKDELLDEFEKSWKAYPSRPGSSKADSLKAWKKRVKDGADPKVILAGVIRYATYCKASGTDPQYIKQPATFFGPGEHYLSDWTVQQRSPPKLSPSDESKLSAARTIFGTAIEGNHHATGRTIDVTPKASGSVGSEDISGDAGKLRLPVPEPVEDGPA